MDFTAVVNYLKGILAFDAESPLLFTQFHFWAFFAIVYAFFALFKSRKLLRNAFLFFVSLLFYYKTSGLSVLILLFVTFSDFFIARRISAADDAFKASGKGLWKKKAWLLTSVTIDLLLLCYFKYAYFFADVVHNIFGLDIRVFNIFAWAGNGMVAGERFMVDSIVLPVGISFFLFQVISYTVDVYRGDVKPVRNILDFGFYVSFFPQLVAGPIVRATEFIPQLYKPFNLSRRQFGIAIFWILNGLAKKIILSDYISVNFVDRVFDNPLLFTGFENLMALFAYSLQVYADFSGYTDIAIGVALLMGFHLPQNFNSPYKAPNPQDFWRRWHMSLSRWLRSYLYIPLGGNRNASFGTYFWTILFSLIALILSGSWVVSLVMFGSASLLGLVAWLSPARRKKVMANINRFITMLLGGLWHGASWNFIIWGGLNGIGMIVYQVWKDMAWWLRSLVVVSISVLLFWLASGTGAPVYNMLFVWMAVTAAGTFVRMIFHYISPDAPGAFAGGMDSRKARMAMRKMTVGQKLLSTAGNVWAVTQTFVFITFTRLFFRSGSNLDPASANEVAWNTARNMVRQIGSKWDMQIIPQICYEYRNVFVLVLCGLIIHWLPARFKRRYRFSFAALPLPVMAVAAVMAVFFLYQFITADLQPFIYFQF